MRLQVWLQSAVANDNWFQVNFERVPTSAELDRLIQYLELSRVACAEEVPLLAELDTPKEER